MAATLRELRGRIRSAGSIKKITKAQEMIATSRIGKAQARLKEARPYTVEITRVLTTLAQEAALDHPLLVEKPSPKRVGVLVVSSDRGLCGAYNSGAFRKAEELFSRLREDGKTPVLYTVGRKAQGYFKFRNWDISESWTGFSERPSYENAAEVAETLVSAFLAGAGDDEESSDESGVDELHIVYTEFVSMLTQRPVIRRLLPLEIEETHEIPDGPVPVYEFEPSPEAVLDALLPWYVESRIFHALLESAAAEIASRRRAMKSATDNANDLLDALTREANKARQAEITQEISEIVGGANALAETIAGS